MLSAPGFLLPLQPRGDRNHSRRPEDPRGPGQDTRRVTPRDADEVPLAWVTLTVYVHDPRGWPVRTMRDDVEEDTSTPLR